MAENEKTTLHGVLEIEPDRESLRKTLSKIQSDIRNNEVKEKVLTKKIDSSKKYKGRAADIRERDALRSASSDLHIREGQIIAELNKKVAAASPETKKKQKSATAEYNAETARMQQLTREKRLEFEMDEAQKNRDQQMMLEAAKLQGKLDQERVKNEGKLEREELKSTSSAETKLEQERIRNQGKLELQAQKDAASMATKMAIEQERSKTKLEVQRQRDQASAQRQEARLETQSRDKAARLEFEKDREARIRRQFEIRQAEKLERSKEKRLARVRSKFSLRNFGFIGKVAQKFQRTLINRTARMLLNSIINSFKTGVQDLYKWSQNNNGMFARAVDSIKEDFRYFADILGSVIGPFIEVLAPKVRNVADAFAIAAERANQFFATLLGRNGYYKAIRVAQQYAGIQNQLLGFDELNVLNGDNDSGGGQFEWKQWDGSELSNIGQKLLKNSKAMIAFGAGLLLFGHPVLGAGLLAAGVLTGYAATQEGEAIQTKVYGVLDELNTMLAITGPYAFALGAILTFSGHPGAGIPMMLAAATAVSVNWNSIVEKMRGPLGSLVGLLGGATFALGAVLAFSDPTPRGKGIGIAMMLTGAASMFTAIALNWDSILDTFKRIMPPITAFLAGSTLVLGAILAFSSINVPLGIQLMAAGAVGLVGAARTSWGSSILQSIKDTTSAIASHVGEWLSTQATKLIAKIKEIGGSVKTWAGDWIEERVRALREKIWDTLERIRAWIANIFGREYTVRVANPGAIWGFSSSDEAYESGNYALGRLMQAAGYASGGTPTTGTLFWAGEAGPEVVTSLNGQATVYNESQLAGSLAAANAGVIEAVYDMANAVVTAIAKKPTGVTVNDVRNAMNSQAMRYGI